MKKVINCILFSLLFKMAASQKITLQGSPRIILPGDALKIDIPEIFKKVNSPRQRFTPLNATQFSLIFPERFKYNADLFRFDGDGAFIQLNEVSNKSYFTLHKEILTKVKVGVTQKGIQPPVFRSQHIRKDSSYCFIIIVPDGADERTVIYGMGDESYSALFTAKYKARSKNLEETVLTTLLSTRKTPIFWLNPYAIHLGRDFFQLAKATRPYYLFASKASTANKIMFNEPALLVYSIEDSSPMSSMDISGVETTTLQLLSGRSLQTTDKKVKPEFLKQPFIVHYSEATGVVDGITLMIKFAILSNANNKVVMIGRSEINDLKGQSEIDRVLKNVMLDNRN